MRNVDQMHLPVVTMKIGFDDRLENQEKSISFSLTPEKFAVLLAGCFFSESQEIVRVEVTRVSSERAAFSRKRESNK